MSEFHCVIQAKGGIGKSLVASWFAQYLRSRTDDPLCVECDASNKTLSRYSGLRVQRIDLLDEDRRINRRRFDELLEVLLADEEKAVVVDNGQGSFEPLAQYLLEMDAVRQLRAAGRQTFRPGVQLMMSPNIRSRILSRGNREYALMIFFFL